MSKEKLNAILDTYNAKAKSENLGFEALFSQGKSFSSSYQKGELDNFESASNQALGFRLIRDDHEACAFTESLEEKDVELAFDEARSSLDFIKKPYEPTFVEQHQYQNLELFNPDLEAQAVESKLQLAREMEEKTRAKDVRITAVPYNGYGDSSTYFRVFNSNGVDAEYSANACYLYSYALAKSGDDNQMAGHSQFYNQFEKLDPEFVAGLAVQKALGKLGATEPKSGKYPCVFHHEAFQSLFSMMLGAFSAESVDKNLSILGGKLGDEVVSHQLEVYDDPLYIGGQGARPFDDEGSSSQRTTLFKEGRLHHYLTNSVYGKKLSLPNTANASRGPKSDLGISPSTVIMKGGSQSFQDLVQLQNTMLVIDTIKSGAHAGYNSVSGDFSLEVEGAFYEQGQKSQALSNFVISGNILEVLKNIEGLGNDGPEDFARVFVPSVFIPEISVAGK